VVAASSSSSSVYDDIPDAGIILPPLDADHIVVISGLPGGDLPKCPASRVGSKNPAFRSNRTF